jgi:RNA polymerase sigma factor (sigma-70 family)
MRDSRTDTVLTRLRAIFTLLRDDPRSDEELLSRFAQEHDEDAFSAVVGRHAPLVWRTCCRVLGEGPDAEDAFQVTFLTLARWAKRHRYGALAGWLFQVARRAALDVRAAVERRRKLEHQQAVEVESGRGEDPAQAETYRLLDEELAELPERLRVPLVLRYLEGKTLEEVARILGCSRPAVSKRLTRGERILRERLSYRGVTIGAGAVGGLLVGTSVGEAAVRSRLIAETTRLAVAFCAGTLESQTAQAALGLLPSKAAWALKSWLIVLLGVGFLFAGVVGWQVMPFVPAAPSPPVGGSDAAPGPAVARLSAVRLAPAPAGPVMAGEVIDAAGKPVPKADVVVLAGGSSEPSRPPEPDRPVWKGRTGENGRFRARLPAKLPTDPSGGLPIRVLACGDGAIGTAAATYQSDGPPVTVRLGKRDPISQTVRDAAGRPVVRARVRIWRIGSVWVRPSAEADRDPDPVAPFWPKPVVTDEDGKFSFGGLEGLSPVIVEVLAPDCARTDALLSDPPGLRRIGHPNWVAGNVRAAGSGKPVAGAEVGYPALFSATEKAGHRPLVFHQVGRDGSFRFAVPPADDILLLVQPPAESQFRPLVQRLSMDGRRQADVQLLLSAADR